MGGAGWRVPTYARCDALPDDLRSKLFWEEKHPDAPCFSMGMLLRALLPLGELFLEFLHEGEEVVGNFTNEFVFAHTRLARL